MRRMIEDFIAGPARNHGRLRPHWFMTLTARAVALTYTLKELDFTFYGTDPPFTPIGVRLKLIEQIMSKHARIV